MATENLMNSTESAHKLLIEAFRQMKSEEGEYKNKPIRDEDIEDFNSFYYIKQHLDVETFAFFDLIGDVDFNLIQKKKDSLRKQRFGGAATEGNKFSSMDCRASPSALIDL